jgi:hypothetical protein
MPNSPNSAPELTEVAREAIERHFVRRFGATIDQGPSRLVRCLGQTAFNPLNLAEAVVQALSTKNELPSEIEGMVVGLGQARYVLRSVASGDNQKEVAAKAAEIVDEAAQAILSLQRRLDERDALLMEARAEIHTAAEASAYYDDAKECDRLNALLAKIDAALNPKEAGR